MFAEADPFWKPPTVYDVLSVVGLILGIASIWYAWYLARKQLRADFRKAADEAVDRVAQMVLGSDVADAARYLRETDRLLGDKEWVRAQMRLDDAATSIAGFASNTKLTAEETKEWTGRVMQLRRLLQQTREHARSRKNRSHLPAEMIAPLDPLISELELLRGRLLSSGHRPTA
jgi:hypothetical protein